jgi:hypothetical protein
MSPVEVQGLAGGLVELLDQGLFTDVTFELFGPDGSSSEVRE